MRGMSSDSLLRETAPLGEQQSPPWCATAVDIVIPVRNEERDLGPSVRRLHAFLGAEFPFTARITIADNASDDGTWSQALALETELDGVRAVRLERPGRGGALRSVWSHSDAAIFAYMDVDLSTGLNALLPLLAPLLSGHSDVAIGTRLARGARALLPLTTDTAWFFDTELLVLAERAGLRIAEVPVDWIDDADSRVKLVATAVADLRGIVRLGTGLARGTIKVPALGDPSPPGLAGRDGRAALGDPSPPGSRQTGGGPARRHGLLVTQLARFTVVGVASTVAYVLLFLLLRGGLGAQGANAVSLLVTAVANTAVNRRVTFGIRGRAQAGRHQVRGLIAFGIGLALTSGALALLHHADARPARATEVSVLIAANLLATIVRFGLYRSWVFRGGSHHLNRKAK